MNFGDIWLLDNSHIFGRIYKMTHRSHNMFDAINLNKLSITIPQISKCVEKNPPKSNSVVNDCEMEEKRSRIRELIDENETLQREFHLEKRDKKFLMKLEKNLFELMKEKHESLSEELGSLKSDWKNLILIDGISALQRRRLEMLLKR
ncbi:hypothetical protein SNEBB_005429 [Seison nebaliae]|nr:hypothetical protein SNEBB_005429 [Seison nebaliae]